MRESDDMAIWTPNFTGIEPSYRGGGGVGRDGLFKFELVSAEDKANTNGPYCEVHLMLEDGGARFERNLLLNYPSGDPTKHKQDKWVHREWYALFLAIGLSDVQLAGFNGQAQVDTCLVLNQAMQNGFKFGHAYVYAGDSTLLDGDNWKYDEAIPVAPDDATAIANGDTAMIPRRQQRYLKKGSAAAQAAQGNGAGNGNGTTQPTAGAAPGLPSIQMPTLGVPMQQGRPPAQQQQQQPAGTFTGPPQAPGGMFAVPPQQQAQQPAPNNGLSLQAMFGGAR